MEVSNRQVPPFQDIIKSQGLTGERREGSINYQLHFLSQHIHSHQPTTQQHFPSFNCFVPSISIKYALTLTHPLLLSIPLKTHSLSCSPLLVDFSIRWEQRSSALLRQKIFSTESSNIPKQFIIQILSKLFEGQPMGLSVSQSRALKQMSTPKRDKGQTAKSSKESANKETAGETDKENLNEAERQRKGMRSEGEESWGRRVGKEESNSEKKMMGSMMSSQSGGGGSLGHSQQQRRAAQREIYQQPPTPTFVHSSSKSMASSTYHPRTTSTILLPPASLQPPPFHADISSVRPDAISKGSRLLEESGVSAAKLPSSAELAPSIVVKNTRGEEISRLDWQVQEEKYERRANLPTGVLMSNKFAENDRHMLEQPEGEVLVKNRRQIMREVMAGRRVHPDQNFQIGSLCGSQPRSIYGKLGLCSEPSY